MASLYAARASSNRLYYFAGVGGSMSGLIALLPADSKELGEEAGVAE
jgi:hypothetical protein